MAAVFHATFAHAVVPSLMRPEPLPTGSCALDPVGSPRTDLPATRQLVDVSADVRELMVTCSRSDFFRFGAGLQQNFAGFSWVYGWGRATYGTLRFYLEVGSLLSPSSYGPGPWVMGENPFRGFALAAGGVNFLEVFVPPPTSGATAGQPSVISVTAHADCTSNAADPIVGARLGLYFYTPEQIDGPNTVYDYYDFLVTPFCPDAAVKDIPVTVGSPVAMLMSLEFTLSQVASTPGISSPLLFGNALNTATVTVVDADGNPITGQSGHVYASPGSLPTVTTTSSTTTTLPPLAAAPLTCNDGVVQSGEECDCPATADPILQGFGCMGATIVPPQDACVVCRQCQLLQHVCEQTALTTTTTTIGGGTTLTTTTIGGGTTTTLPGQGACAGLAGVALASCLLEAGLDTPLCGDEPIPPKTLKGVRKPLEGAAKRLGRAVTAKEKSSARLVKRARKLLGTAVRKADAAARSSKATRAISDACAGAIRALVTAVEGPLASGL